MLSPETFALQFARALDLFRAQAPKEEQKRQFRTLVGLVKDGGVAVRVTDGRLYVNGTLVDVPHIAPLRDRLELHAVGEMVVPHDAPAAHVYELLKALADQPGMEATSLTDRLKVAGADGVSVSLSHVDAAALPTPGSAAVDAPSSDPDAPPRPEPDALAPAVVRPRTTDQVLAGLAAHPGSGTVPDTLAVLSRQIEVAVGADRIEEALRIASGIIEIEERVPEGSRRSFAIALKRVFTKSLLEAFAGLAGVPQHRDAALRVLSRGGDDGVEILLDKLANAPSIDERRNLFAALSHIKKGQDQLIHLLGHAQWFVVRNVAELLGELGLEASAHALSKQLAHPDERVRGAVALALAKIGTAGAVEPLRRALRDPTVAVRLQVAFGVSGRKAGALAMPIVVAIEQEQDPDVARELMQALGRIASPDAVQALIKFAQPGGRLFGRKPAARRLAAVEALRVAATPAAIGTLQGLAEDSEKEVKSAALAALAELKR